MFRPNMFFLLLLPPIIFESGYSLHKVRFTWSLGGGGYSCLGVGCSFEFGTFNSSDPSFLG